MKIHAVILASTALLVSGMAHAQQQYDSLGSPTPAPNQSASPNSAGPNFPMPAGKVDSAETTGKAETNGTGATTGSSTTAPSNGGANGPIKNTGTSTATDPGATPSGLTPD